MDAILRAALVYVLVLIIFPVTGKRILTQVTTFDLLLLIVSEATRQALLGQDYSITMAVLVIITLVWLDRFGDYLGWRIPRMGQIIDGSPVALIERGRTLEDRLKAHHLDMDEVLQQARSSQGVRGADEIDYAMLERSGSISTIPKQG